MEQATYRIVPQSITLYGVEVAELGEAPQILLTCPTKAAAEAWMAEIKRLRSAKYRLFKKGPP
jgi:hypothetical protein